MHTIIAGERALAHLRMARRASFRSESRYIRAHRLRLRLAPSCCSSSAIFRAAPRIKAGREPRKTRLLSRLMATILTFRRSSSNFTKVYSTSSPQLQQKTQNEEFSIVHLHKWIAFCVLKLIVDGNKLLETVCLTKIWFATFVARSSLTFM